MTNHELTSVWTLKETTAFEDALERRKLRQGKAGSASTSEPARPVSTESGELAAAVPTTSQQSGGLMIRIAGMAVGVVALAAIATFGLVG